MASHLFAQAPATGPATSPSTAPATLPTFRTDGDGDSKIPWFALRPGEFPPAGSAHAIAGELIALDPINRTGVLRPDRTDAQRRDDWDIPLLFMMLPFGSIRYHGAPAELRDVPIGTHLHGQFYTWGDEKPPGDESAPKSRKPIDAAFGRVLLLEDDFSHAERLGRSWRVDAIATDAGTLTVTGIAADGKADAKSTIFQLGPFTRVWKERGLGALSDVTVGKSIVMNLTVCTLKGPGRVTEIWLDAESRAAFAAHQTEVHRRFVREHGLGAWIDAVDNKEGLVTATLFGGFDPALAGEFEAEGAITAAVAEASLRTYDQINDRKRGSIVEIRTVPAAPGNSGVQIVFKPEMLLEGFRPKRFMRLWAGKWKVDDLPREERLYQ